MRSACNTLLASFLAVLCLAGCGDSDDTGAGPAKAPPPRPRPPRQAAPDERAQPAAPSTGAPSGDALSTASLLPVGTHAVDLMDAAYPPEVAEIWRRIQQAQLKHPQWLPEYTAAHAKEGEPLPYHPNFGVSREDYQKALAGEPRIVKVGQAELTIERRSDGALALRGSGVCAALEGIVLNPSDRSLTTPLGACGAPTVVRGRQMRNLGLWDGYAWVREDDRLAASGDALFLRFQVGRFRDTGRTLIYYRATRASGGTVDAKITVVAVFSPRSAGKSPGP